MNRITTRAADQSTANGQHPATPARRGRLGSAVASVLVTVLVFGSVVFGMTDMAADGAQIAGASTSAQRA